MTLADLVTVGLSESANDKLDELKEMGIFAEKMDGYRFAASLAIAHGVIPPDLTKRTTLFNVGSLDPDQYLRKTIEALMPGDLSGTTPYRLLERLADWGVTELYLQSREGDIDFVAILNSASVQG